MRRREGKKNRGVKTFRSLRVTSLVHTRTTTVLERGHLPHQVRQLSCYFQHLQSKLTQKKLEWKGRVMW